MSQTPVVFEMEQMIEKNLMSLVDYRLVHT